MSPSEPRRTTRKRGSGMRHLADRVEERAGGVVFGIADDGDANAEAISDGAFGHGFGSVVGALDVDAGTKFLEEPFDVRLGEDDDVIDHAERGNEQRAGVFVEDGAAGTFQPADTGIGVHADHEDVSLLFGAREIADVADVQRVEAAVGEDNGLAATLFVGQEFFQLIAGDNFGQGGAHGSGMCSGGGSAYGFEKLSARGSGGAALHDDQAAGDVGEVSGFERRSTTGEPEGVGGENGVAGAGDVHG